MDSMESVEGIDQEDLKGYRHYLRRQARMIEAIARVEGVSFPELLAVMGVSEGDFLRFRAGFLDLTGFERLALGRKLRIRPDIFQDLADNCLEAEFREYEEWVRSRSKWKMG